MSNPIQDFHDILEAMPVEQLAEMRDNFLNDLTISKSTYGNRLLTKYLRPKFLTREQVKHMRYVCTVLRSTVVKVKDAYFEGADFIEDIGLSDQEKELVEIDPGFSRICVTSRWDSFWGPDGMKFVELNAECPAGVAYSDIMSESYFRLPVMEEFKKKYRVHSFHVREILLHAFLVTYLMWKGEKSRRMVPNIAIVDWKEVPTYSEFELIQDFFELHGVPAVIADPRELEYRNGRLYKGDFEIDLIYRRVLIREFMEKIDEVRPMLQAYQDHKICVINSFRTKLVHKKSLFAVLSDSKNAKYFSEEEREIIANHIPWTRVVRECKTDYNGKQVDLLDFIEQNKDNLVIKPNDEYGGEGVVIGWESTPEKWAEAIRNCETDLCVAQERVPLPREKFPYFDNGLKFDDMLVDLDPYLFGVNMAGVLTRLSGSSLANVTAGGGAVVTFVVEEKK